MQASNSQNTNTADTNAWVKIDLSNLDQTGLDQPAIYMLGYASASGQILQQDPVTQKIFLGPPVPSNLTLPSSQFTASGSSVTLATSANLFVGGAVTFSNGTRSTIKAITANLVCANQPVGNGAFQPYANAAWQTGSNVVILGPASVNQGTVGNVNTGSQVTGLPSAAGTSAGVGLGSLLNGYFTPQGGMPTANATVSGGTVTGFSGLQANNGCYQYPPMVSFPGSGVTVVAQGSCTLDANGYVNGVSITTSGAGYVAGNTYQAVFGTAPGNTYFFPSDANGFPGATTASDAATVSALNSSGGSMTITLSQSTDQPAWASASPFTLGSAAINVYTGGCNANGYASLQSFVAVPSTLSTPNASIAGLPSTQAVSGYNTQLNSAGSSLVVQGVAGSVMVYSVVSYTIAFADAVPAGTTALTFSASIAGTVSADGNSLSISATTYAGVASALAIGQIPAITCGTSVAATASITALLQTNGSITVSLSSALPSSFYGQSVSIDLPPTGGVLPVMQWDSTVNNAIWVEQTPGAAGTMSVNGSRIYFVLDTPKLGPPNFGYSISTDASGNAIVTVVQPPDALVWQGQVSPFQYVELTADALPLTGGGSGGGDGMVYIDLSAVDGFFFPAALSTGNLLVGQPWRAYTAPNTVGPSTYAAVTRQDILSAWSASFSTANFPDATALQSAYAALMVENAGIQNPTFAYASGNTAIPAFDSCWDSALNDLFSPTASTSNEVDLVGDLLINGATAYYKGTQVVVTANSINYNAIAFVEYAGSYTTNTTSGMGKTGAIFWVFDPRTPPPTEAQAFIQAGSPMTAGYQVFANTGVFASTTLVQGGSTPNYLPGNSAWSSSNALKQLLSLQRDIVTALNRGVGGLGIGTLGSNQPGAGVTNTYWNAEANWYPFLAPYVASTPQNLFAQWVHTAVIDASSNQYYATYPFGSASGYGDPAQAAGATGAGTGAFMNQTYGFGYDETPNSAANVPSKFLPLTNQAGGTVTFQLVFGPWGT